MDATIDRVFYELARMTRQFGWLVAIQVTVLLAIFGTMLNSVHR
jgi:hypothetical protein